MKHTESGLDVLLLEQASFEARLAFVDLAALLVEGAQVPFQFLEADGLAGEEPAQALPLLLDLTEATVVDRDLRAQGIHVLLVELGVALKVVGVNDGVPDLLPDEFLQRDRGEEGKDAPPFGSLLLEHLSPATVVALLLACTTGMHAPQAATAVTAVEHVPQQVLQALLVLAPADPPIVRRHLSALLEGDRAHDGRHRDGNPGLPGMKVLCPAPYPAMLVGLAHVQGILQDAAHGRVRPCLRLPMPTVVSHLVRRLTAQRVQTLGDGLGTDALLRVPFEHPPHDLGLRLLDHQDVLLV